MFSGKSISRALYCYFLVDTIFQMTLIKYLLPEAAVGIDAPSGSRYIWGHKKSFVGNWVEVVILALMAQYTFFNFIYLFIYFAVFLNKNFIFYLFIYLFIHLFRGRNRATSISQHYSSIILWGILKIKC